MIGNKNITAYKLGLKDRIVDLAMELFVDKGIKAVRMDDIAQRLAISKRTLYELYDNKEDLLCEGVRRHRLEHDGEMKAMMDAGKNVIDIILYLYKKNIEGFRKVNPRFFSDIVKYPRVVDMLEADRATNRQHFQDFLRRGVNEGYFRPDVNYELVATLSEAFGDLVMSAQLYVKYGLDTLLRTMVFTSLRGFCTLEGVKMLDAFKL